MADQTFDGHTLRVLTIVDNCSRVSPAIEVRRRDTGYGCGADLGAGNRAVWAPLDDSGR